MKRIYTLPLFAAALLAMPAALAQAPAYPTKPLRLVVPFSPGGASDLTARTLAQKMGESMGQSIVVDNKPGANGVLGIDLVAKSPPDGYTILLTDRGSPGGMLALAHNYLLDMNQSGMSDLRTGDHEARQPMHDIVIAPSKIPLRARVA